MKRRWISTLGVYWGAIIALAAVAPAQGAGQVLSWFNTNLSDIYGLDIREAGGTELHLMTGSGAVYSFRVDTASAVKNGMQSQYDSVSQMTNPGNSPVTLRGLAIVPTDEGSYTTAYVAVQDNRAEYRSRWGVDGTPGLLTWGLINGAWSLYMDGDIAPASRTAYNPALWSTCDTTIYRYPYALWVGQSAFTAAFTMPKPLRGVSLGANNDLWVLCQDGEILNVSATDGGIIRRFYLSAAIASPWGIAYDAGENSLWIANRSDNRIYQVAAATSWQINAQSPSDPLVFTAPNGSTVHPAHGLGPAFVKSDGSVLAPGGYTASLVSSAVVNGYTVLHCRATASGLSATYTLQFRELAPSDPSDPNGMEMLVSADPDNRTAPGYVSAAAFYPGTFQANGIKQLYTGERAMEAFPGNYGAAALLYWPAGQLYFYAIPDGDYSNAAGAWLAVNPKTQFLINNPAVSAYTTYDALSDGSRPVLKDRYVFRVSANPWNAYGLQTNTPSEYRNELSQMLFFDDWGGSFPLGKFALQWLKSVAGDALNFYTIVEGWANGGFDDADPDAYRIPDHNTPGPAFGTKPQLIDYVNYGKTVGRIGLRCNYMVAADGSWSIQEGLVKKALDAAGTPQWFTNYHTAKPLVDRQETDIQTDFATTAVFHDQWTSGNPINMDGAAPGAARPMAATQEIIRQICQSAKAIHQGPMGSESLFVEYLLGQYVDTGDFGIMSGNSRYDFFPEYKLRRLHALSTFHGMGLGYRFFTGTGDIDSGNKAYFLSDDSLDGYRACEVLYGNGAYLFYIAGDRYGLRKVHALTECFTVGLAQRYYALQPVDFVQYGYSGQWKTFDQIVPASASLSAVQAWFRKVHIRYANGCHVWVNRDNTTSLSVTLPSGVAITLPQSGWAVYTEDGRFTAYTALSGAADPDPGKRVDFAEDLNRAIKYVNPRTAAAYAGAAKPTVWRNGQVQFVLDDPAETFAQAYLATLAQPVPGKRAGDILSFFASGEAQVWGLDATGIVDNTLHLVAAAGQVYSYSVNSVKAITSGAAGTYDSKTRMMNPATNISLRGLALLPTYEGPSAAVYIAAQDNRAIYRARWGLDGDIGNMSWALINGANTLYITGDITPASRSQDNPDIWGTYSNTIYRYPYPVWTAADSFTKKLIMPKSLYGVSLGDHDDLWVLCQDREILHIAAADGTILDRFYLPGQISQPWGIAYDRKGALWISNRADKAIYQVAAVGGVMISGSITLQNFAGDKTAVPVTIDVYAPGGQVPLETHVIHTDTTGRYSLVIMLKGTYDIAAKAPNWLRGRLANVTIATGTTANFALVNGDANGDDVVSFEDFAILQNNYGQSGKTGRDGDFNGDGRVGFDDFSILQNSYGQTGAAPAPEAALAAPTLCTPLGLALLALAACSLFFLKNEK